MSPATLRDNPTVEKFFNVVEAETLTLIEHLPFEFRKESDVFAQARTRRTRDFELLDFMRGVLYCYYRDIWGIRPVARELNNTVVWLSFGFDQAPSRDAVGYFSTDLKHIVDNIFYHLVEQASLTGLLDLSYSIDSKTRSKVSSDKKSCQQTRLTTLCRSYPSSEINCKILTNRLTEYQFVG